MLEYNSVTWSPHLKCDITVLNIYLTRIERLTKLGIPSLELRRLYLGFTYCYKIVFELVTLNMTDFFEFSEYTGPRGHAYKLYIPRSDCTVRINFFANSH